MKYRIVSIIAALAAVLFMSTSAANAAGSYSNEVVYSGQGLSSDGMGGLQFDTQLCGADADAEGGYILWVFTATKADHADITLPDGTHEMTQSGGGAFKYVSRFFKLSTLAGNVSGTYDGAAKNAQLVISHGCPGFPGS